MTAIPESEFRGWPVGDMELFPTVLLGQQPGRRRRSDKARRNHKDGEQPEFLARSSVSGCNSRHDGPRPIIPLYMLLLIERVANHGR